MSALITHNELAYAELCVTTNFTFLTGASHPEEYMVRAAQLGLKAIAITDRNSLAGIVRAFSARKEIIRHAKENDIELKLPKLIVGARLVLDDSDVEWVALPTDRAAYQRLSRLLTLGKRRAEKGTCILHKNDLVEWGKGMILIGLPPRKKSTLKQVLPELLAISRHFPGNVFLGAAPDYDGRDQKRFNHFALLARRAAIPMVAVGDVMMHISKRRQLADVLTCLREGIKIDHIGTKALTNSERR